jgi:hypothetical protein
MPLYVKENKYKKDKPIHNAEKIAPKKFSVWKRGKDIVQKTVQN